MKIATSTVTKLSITGIDDLDPVNVFVEDFKKGCGRLTVECFGEAWSHYWGGMGDCSILEFITKADIGYIAGKLFPSGMERSVIDYEKISTEIGEEDICRETLLLHEVQVARVYGEDWRFDLPKKPSRQWEYLCRIVGVVKGAASSQRAEAA